MNLVATTRHALPCKRFRREQDTVAELIAERATGRLRARNRHSQPYATETPRL